MARITVSKTVENNVYLFREGQPSLGFYVVQRCAINVHRVNALGTEQDIHIFRAGESLAEATSAMATGYPADALAIEPSRALLVENSGLGMGQVCPKPFFAVQSAVNKAFSGMHPPKSLKNFVQLRKTG